ncbi:erythromycin esterase family protein [Hellea sp.]|nr:erythromycin esterase family protein [Hellea sp.]
MTDTLEVVYRDLCDEHLVILGESGAHGDKNALSFKALLVETLVSKCNFNVVLFEASFYDLKKVEILSNNGTKISAETLSSAIGVIHNQNYEMHPLINFLTRKVNSNSLLVGGIDDQLGSRGAFYSLKGMVSDLTSGIEGPQQDRCETLLKNRILYTFPKNDKYDEMKKTDIQTCLKYAAKGIENKELNSKLKLNYELMIKNFDRAVARDFIDESEYVFMRDYSMYLNVLNYLEIDREATDKIIIWSTNDHVAKRSEDLVQYQVGKNMGTYLSENQKQESVTVGFTALEGTTRVFGSNVKEIPLKSSISIEAYAYNKDRPVKGYLTSNDLVSLKLAEGSLFMHETDTKDWHTLFDIIVVFENEEPSRREG